MKYKKKIKVCQHCGHPLAVESTGSRSFSAFPMISESHELLCERRNVCHNCRIVRHTHEYVVGETALSPKRIDSVS
jgi:hypothetical protein